MLLPLNESYLSMKDEYFKNSPYIICNYVVMKKLNEKKKKIDNLYKKYFKIKDFSNKNTIMS